MRRSFMRVVRLASLVVVASLSLVVPVAAREPVDPNTLNPPPPDFFNATCERVGAGVICDLAFSDPPFADEPSRIICGGTELLVSQTRSVVGKRFYDANGDLLRRHFREAFAGTLTNPSTGLVADWTGHDTVVHVLSVPGDLATGAIVATGSPVRVTAPSGAAVLVDAGRTVVDAATDELVGSSGPHRFDDYFARGDLDALEPICNGLS